MYSQPGASGAEQQAAAGGAGPSGDGGAASDAGSSAGEGDVVEGEIVDEGGAS
jgi:hypothetical protein